MNWCGSEGGTEIQERERERERDVQRSGRLVEHWVAIGAPEASPVAVTAGLRVVTRRELGDGASSSMRGAGLRPPGALRVDRRRLLVLVAGFGVGMIAALLVVLVVRWCSGCWWMGRVHVGAGRPPRVHSGSARTARAPLERGAHVLAAGRGA